MNVRSFSVGDYNDDNYDDLCVGGYSLFPQEALIGVLMNAGNGTFIPIDTIEIAIKKLIPSFSFTLEACRPSHNKEIEECFTLGDHLRRTRTLHNDSQSCVAHLIGIETDTITS